VRPAADETCAHAKNGLRIARAAVARDRTSVENADIELSRRVTRVGM